MNKKLIYNNIKHFSIILLYYFTYKLQAKKLIDKFKRKKEIMNNYKNIRFNSKKSLKLKKSQSEIHDWIEKQAISQKKEV